MRIELSDTTAANVAQAIVRARRGIGSPAMGMVLTLVVSTDEEHVTDCRAASMEASREHPSRILTVVRTSNTESRLDAEIMIGEGTPGESVTLRLGGDLVHHPDSVTLPLLLPDSPVVVWWPQDAPADLSTNKLGALGRRRISDAANAEEPLASLHQRAERLEPGDSDLTWTRLTGWRALLAASLDQTGAEITAAVVEGAADNPSAQLLAAWLESRLQVPVFCDDSAGPGITRVQLITPEGAISLSRADGSTATYAVPHQPERSVALRRRDPDQLLAEELRRLDPDQIFEAACRMLVERAARGTASGATSAQESARSESA